MRAAFRKWQQSDEILDLTAPATDTDGLVARWLRLSLSNSVPDPAHLTRERFEDPAARPVA
jgi:hypothetical protein